MPRLVASNTFKISGTYDRVITPTYNNSPDLEKPSKKEKGSPGNGTLGSKEATKAFNKVPNIRHTGTRSLRDGSYSLPSSYHSCPIAFKNRRVVRSLGACTIPPLLF